VTHAAFDAMALGVTGWPGYALAVALALGGGVASGVVLLRSRHDALPSLASVN